MYTGFAQTEHGVRSTNPADTSRYLASKSSQNWFISIDGSINWWQDSDRNPAGNYSKILNGPTFGGGIAFGKWITHKTAFRLAYDVNRSHSFIDGLHNTPVGDKFRFLYDNNPTPDANGYCATTFMYHNVHADLMLSPIDIIQNYYDAKRVYNPILFIGMGIACVSGHTSMIKTILDGRCNYEFSADAGLINQFRLNKYLDITLSFLWTAQRYNIDSWFNEYGAHGTAEPRPRVADFNYSVRAGLSWYPGGRIYELPYKYTEVLKETTEIIKHIHDTIPCQEQPIVNITGNDTVTEIISVPLSIFFHLDKSTLMSGRDKVNLREIAEVVKAKRWTVHLRGSCDSATATAEYNKGLALRRCHTIMNILIDMGVPEELIDIEPVGGVKELDPTEYDRRVIITLGKKINNK